MLSLKEKIIKSANDAIKAGTAFLLFKKSETVKKDGLTFHFHFYDREIYEGDHPPIPLPKDPLQPPYPKAILAEHLTKERGAHYLQVNKFSFKIGHMIGSSDNPSAIQGDELNKDDFACFSELLQDFGNSGIGYYNSGFESGCSQIHKHIQYIPHDDNPIALAMSKGVDLPYLYYNAKLDNYSAECIKDAYQKIHSQMLVGPHGSDIRHFNFVVTNKNVFIVPRQKARHQLGITVNSLGVSGHFFIYEEDKLKFMDKPLEIITDLCYRK